ncbi:MAG: XrtA system polysaccharide chain length determinant [Solirubrobacterales bacterium]
MLSVLRYIPIEFHAPLRPYWRRRWTILAVSWVLSFLGWLVVAILPDRYEAMTRLYVETESLLTPLLRNITVETDLQNQLEVMQRTLLNRNNLAAVARAAGFEAEAKGDVELETTYQRLQKKILVTAEGRNLFSVTYRDPDPERALKVVSSLLEIFVATNVGQTRSNMEEARSFIENQIQEYEKELQAAEHRLADYKMRNAEMLTAIGNNFSGRLETARREQSETKIKMDEAVIARDQLKAHLATLNRYIEVDAPPQVVINGGTSSGGSLSSRISALEAELAQLRVQYTDRHPDVLTVERQLEALKRQAERAGITEGPAHGRMSNPVYEQVNLRLIQAEADLATARSRYQVANETMTHLSTLAETAPRIEAELADLNREYGVIKTRYEDLLGRRESARISEAVQTSGDRIQFRVIDAPHVPAIPAWPNRPLFLSGVLILAIGAGGFLVYMLQKMDATVGSAEALAADFSIRVLGFVPEVDSPNRARERQVSLRRFATASGSLLLAYGILMGLALFAASRWHGIAQGITNAG